MRSKLSRVITVNFKPLPRKSEFDKEGTVDSPYLKLFSCKLYGGGFRDFQDRLRLTV